MKLEFHRLIFDRFINDLEKVPKLDNLKILKYTEDGSKKKVGFQF